MKQDETSGPRISMDFSVPGENLALKRAVMKARREIDELVPQPTGVPCLALPTGPTVLFDADNSLRSDGHGRSSLVVIAFSVLRGC